MRRLPLLLAAFLSVAVAFAPSLADARAGGGSSFGSRGGRTYMAPPSTNTAPYSAAPMERSLTPRSAPTSNYANPGYAQPYGSGFGRSPFMSGLMGGLIGAGIGGLLLGRGFWGFGGGFGFLGFLLQIFLLVLLARMLLRWIFGRQPAFAGFRFPRMGQPAQPGLGGFGMGGGAAPAAAPVTITRTDYQEFERLLKDVQSAWTARDIGRLQALSTPEMVNYFNEQLSDQASRGVWNEVTDVRLEKGDLAEAWSEGSREFATVAMRFSMMDVTRDASGRIVDGSVTTRSMATELWTFVRAPGGHWILSAIQQGR